jgi:predicted permease
MHVWHDVRQAVRLLATDRGFTILAAAALALGIGVNSTFFSLVNAAVLRGLPIDEPHEVMFLSLRDTRNAPRAFSYPEYEDLRRDSRAFASVGAYAAMPMTLADEDVAPERVLGVALSAASMDALRVPPVLGRAFAAEDDRVGAPAVVLLSERIWRGRYGGQASVLGRRMLVSGEPATAIGVMPDHFRFPGNADVWRPLGSIAALTGQARDAPRLNVFARLAGGSSRAQAQSELESFRDVWAARHPTLYDGLRASIVPINQQFFGRVSDTVWLAFITAGALVLLIACANVANLLLMRAAARGREIAIRTSLGATRRRIVQQLLLESALLALLGAAAGLAVSFAGLHLLQTAVPAEVAALFDFTLDSRVLAALLATTVASVFVFGITPALHLARRSATDLLRDSRDNAPRSRGRWATAFLAAEFALTLVLLANVAMGVRVADAAREAQFAIDPRPLLTMSVTLPDRPYDSPESRNRFVDRFADAVTGLPDVSSIAVASALPGAGGAAQQVTVAGRPIVSAASAPMAVTLLVGERYFETIGAPLLRGRTFSPTDGTPGEGAAIVNERFTTLYLANEDPIGTLIRLATVNGQDSTGPWIRIVGVSPSIGQSSAGGVDPDPVVYLPWRSSPSPTAAIIVRTNGNPAALTPAVREAVRRLDASLPVDRAMTMAEAMRVAQWTGRISRVLLHGISTIALLLALVGLYAVTAHSVRLRRKELGIRLALGAGRREIAAQVLGRAMWQLVVGLTAGLGATIAFDRLFTTTAMRLTDPMALLPTMFAIVLVGLAACLWPASRAVRLDPALVLRDE